MARRTDACSTALRRAAVLALAALPGASGLGATAPAPAASEPATQQVQVTAPLPGARDEKTLSQQKLATRQVLVPGTAPLPPGLSALVMLAPWPH